MPRWRILNINMGRQMLTFPKLGFRLAGTLCCPSRTTTRESAGLRPAARRWQRTTGALRAALHATPAARDLVSPLGRMPVLMQISTPDANSLTGELPIMLFLSDV